MVHYGQLYIDPYEERTGDKALYSGHSNSDKAIGTAVLGIPVYAVYQQARGFEDYSQLRGNRVRGPRPVFPSVELGLLSVDQRVDARHALSLLLAGLWSVGFFWLVSVTEPLVPAEVEDPLREFWLDRFANEQVQLNVGEIVIGLSGYWSRAPPVMVIAASLVAFAVLIRARDHTDLSVRV